MKIVKIDKGEWKAGLTKAAESYRLLGPQKEKSYHSFRPLEAGELPADVIASLRETLVE